MVRRFCVAKEMGHGGSCLREFVSGLIDWCAFMIGDTVEGGGAFLWTSGWRIFAVSRRPLLMVFRRDWLPEDITMRSVRQLAVVK